MADDVNTQLVALCKYCDKKVNKKVKCVNCAAVFHKSCATRKTCCNKQELQKENQKNNNSEESEEEFNDALMEALKAENKLLQDFNQELREMNQLLKEKIYNLEAEINFVKKSTTNTPNQLSMEENKNEKTNEELIRNKIAQEVKLYFNNNNIINKEKQDKKIIDGDKNQQQKRSIPDMEYKGQKSSKQASDKKSRLENDMTNLEQKQRQVMNDVINLGASYEQDAKTINETHKIKTNGNIEKGKPSYKEILAKKPKRDNKNMQIGDGSTDEGLVGIQKRIWVFLSRVKLHVTAEKIQKYLCSKPNMKERTFIVEELKLKRTQTKAFKIGVEYVLKDEVYQPNFWPKGVGFSRYTFPRQNTKDNNEQNWEEQNKKNKTNFRIELETVAQT